jgi:hypothetical protein
MTPREKRLSTKAGSAKKKPISHMGGGQHAVPRGEAGRSPAEPQPPSHLASFAAATVSSMLAGTERPNGVGHGGSSHLEDCRDEIWTWDPDYLEHRTKVMAGGGAKTPRPVHVWCVAMSICAALNTSKRSQSHLDVLRSFVIQPPPGSVLCKLRIIVSGGCGSQPRTRCLSPRAVYHKGLSRRVSCARCPVQRCLARGVLFKCASTKVCAQRAMANGSLFVCVNQASHC